MTRALEFTLPFEIKLAQGSGEIAGYASTFGNVDLVGDVIAPGAFAATLAEHRAADTAPAMLWAHDPAEPIGAWTDARTDGKGLLVAGKLSLETRRGAEARALAKAGALALSIGYRTRDAAFENGQRVLKDIQLFEVSLVSIPANPEARLTSIKGLAIDAGEIRDAIGFERFLKKSGFANSLARRLAAGWDSAIGRRDDDEALTEIVARSKTAPAASPSERTDHGYRRIQDRARRARQGHQRSARGDQGDAR
jgi:HK97 family phage prohead protease